MNEPLTIRTKIHFVRHGPRKQIVGGATPSTLPGRIPRVTRLMALAIKFEGLVRQGQVADYAELARLGQVTRARMTQVMNLVLLAPDLQEELLFLPHVEGRDSIRLRQLQPIARVVDWRQQRRLWKQLGLRTDPSLSTGQSAQPTDPPSG